MTVVASKYQAIENDLYETPAWVTRALLRYFSLEGRTVWEPAAGNHKMADALREAGADVLTSDVKQYGRPHDFTLDFLNGKYFPGRPFDAIVTNPPYGKGNRDAAAFARLALDRCSGLVALLLTAKFDFGKTRADLFGNCPRFVAKIALVDRIQWFAGEHQGTEDHAWFCWAPAAFADADPRLLYGGRDR